MCIQIGLVIKQNHGRRAAIDFNNANIRTKHIRFVCGAAEALGGGGRGRGWQGAGDEVSATA